MPLADPIDVAVGYLIAKHGLDLDEAEALVKADSPMGAANTGLDRGREWLRRNKTIESARAAYRTAASRELAEELADKLLEYNPSLTRERALARVYETNPQLYQGELSVSDLQSHRQTRSDHDRRRFA
jgi:hypothetical protein